MNNQQLIASDLTKKQKAVEAQRRYRLRLKAGEPANGGSKITQFEYLQSNALYMREWRANKKKAVIKAYAEVNPTETKSTTEKKIQNVEKKVSIIEQRKSGRES